MWLIFKRHLVYPLKRILKGVKEKMKNSVLLNLGVMLMPFGIVVAFEALRQGHSLIWFALGVWGIFISFLGVVLIIYLLRDAKRKDIIEEIKQKDRDQVSKDTLSELKTLSQHLKGSDKNGGSKDNLH